MIPEIGIFALIIALLLCLLQGIFPLIGATKGIASWIILAKPLANGQLIFVSIAFAALTWSFISNDFSVTYVAQNSNTKLPLIYRISGVWGSHEGSLLLWMLILSGWTAAVTIFSRSIPEEIVAQVLSVLGLVSVGFLLFILLTSNPFERQFPIPLDGRDLNPLLQDPGLAIHPPMLYIGYVGFAVPFAFAIAALISGRLDSAWARWSRPWTTLAWVFLTAGIALGSWWAYNELGWGGWWFWDPVENASFMPWLAGTALIHSLIATEKRGAFKAWTVLLAVFAFSLCLLGTFLVRSGILTSVHAFATDPARGVFILIFLALVIGGSLSLYAWRAPLIRSSGQFDIVSREVAILLNNILLVASAMTILLGTLYPLILDSLQLGKISVGPPYFNSVFVPLAVPAICVAGIGICVRWKRDRIVRIVKVVWIPFVFSITLGLTLPAIGMPHYSMTAALASVLGVWIVSSAAHNLWYRMYSHNHSWAPRNVSAGIYGMALAHAGVGVLVIGIGFTSAYTVEKDLRMSINDEYVLNGYQYRFEGVSTRQGPNYTSLFGEISVLKDGHEITKLYPEKRTYLVQESPMTEPGIDVGLFRDLYVVLGEPLDNNNTWSIRIYHNTFVRWIWLGPLIMALGGLLAALDVRYRKITLQSRKESSLTGRI